MDIQEKNKYWVVGGAILFLVFCGFIVSLNKKILRETQQVPASTPVILTKEVPAAAANLSAMPVGTEATSIPEAGGAAVSPAKESISSSVPQPSLTVIHEEPMKSDILVQ